MSGRIKSGLVILVTLCLLGAACNSSSDDAFPPITAEVATQPTSTATTDTTSSTTETTVGTTGTTAIEVDSIPDPSDGEAFDEYIAGRVEAFYEVRNLAFAEPSATPEVDYPELAELAAEPQLSVMRQAIIELHEAGRADREPIEPSVGTTTGEEHRVSGVQTVEGSIVTAFDCEVYDDETIEVATADVKIAGTITILRVVSLELFGDDWKVTESKVSQKIEGVAGCYLAGEAEFPY